MVKEKLNRKKTYRIYFLDAAVRIKNIYLVEKKNGWSNNIGRCDLCVIVC